MAQVPAPVEDQEPNPPKRKNRWLSLLGLVAIVVTFFAVVRGVQLQPHTVAPSTVSPSSPPVHQSAQPTAAPVVATASWPMYMHDISHSNYDPDEKLITPAT